ncbi:hypothetical protein F53441_7525 [Fusarium austroafricanum]|uniref:Uncharacterized protein n=1 Tax=Fusarium austroafricanum TaxID=2364996 RepID=A0A8H4NS30_9HYPO|nr:hypothetical protein F53441_7525 [Fusarium austroafricanum]
MISSYSTQEDAPGFKISFSDDMNAERRIFQLVIQDLSKWRDQLKPKQRAHQMVKRCLISGETKGQWTITNGSFVDDQQYFLILEPEKTCEPGSPDSSSSCDSPMYTWEDMGLLVGTQDPETIDTVTITERVKTSLILEGKLTPPPDRDYEGDLAPMFRYLAAEEEREKLHRKRAARKQQSDLVDDSSKGWKFLHSIIFAGQGTAHGSKKFPPYHPNQRAFLLLLRPCRSGSLTTYSVRNLEACTKDELLELIEQLEIWGWNHMIYVTNEDEEMPYPYRIEGERKAEVLEWR